MHFWKSTVHSQYIVSKTNIIIRRIVKFFNTIVQFNMTARAIRRIIKFILDQ